jgi:hypothetical protein
LLDIIKNDDGFYFVAAGQQMTEGPFDTIEGMAAKMADRLEETVRYAWSLKFGETLP